MSPSRVGHRASVAHVVVAAEFMVQNYYLRLCVVPKSAVRLNGWDNPWDTLDDPADRDGTPMTRSLCVMPSLSQSPWGGGTRDTVGKRVQPVHSAHVLGCRGKFVRRVGTNGLSQASDGRCPTCPMLISLASFGRPTCPTGQLLAIPRVPWDRHWTPHVPHGTASDVQRAPWDS